MADPLVREFLLGFWKIHILFHAAEECGVYGQWMLEELRHHGYRLSPGTLYPVLARMATRGWLEADASVRATDRRVYHITPKGAEVLARLRTALDELQHEVSEHHHEPRATQRRRPATASSRAGSRTARAARAGKKR